MNAPLSRLPCLVRRDRPRLFVVFVVLIALLSMLACYSTACMSNEDIYTWLDTGTPQPCFSSEYR